MRFSLAVIAVAASASATLVARQADFPSCATPCILGGNVPTGDCSATDNACLCKNPEFVAATTQCVTTNCQGDDLRAALDFARKLCLAVGVTLSDAPPASTSSGGQSSSPSGSAPQSTPTSPTSTRSTGGSSTSGANTSAATNSGANTNTNTGTPSGSAPPSQSSAPNGAFTNAIPALNALAGMVGMVALAL